MISRKYNFFCPRMGKNASSTLVSYFQNFDTNLIDEGHEAILDTGLEAFMRGDHRCRVVDPSFFDDCFKFAFVRNPYDRLVSAWFEFKKEGMFWNVKDDLPEDVRKATIEDFNSFVEFTRTYDHIHWCVQTDTLYSGEKQLVDYIGKFENLNDEINALCAMIGIDNSGVEVPFVRKSAGRGKKYAGYYSEESIDYVSRKYASDISTFGYTFE